jgi:hypothetical protein
MPLRFAITATRRSQQAADTAAFGPKQEYRPLADLLTRGTPASAATAVGSDRRSPDRRLPQFRLWNARSHADRRGNGYTSAPAM